MRPARALIDLDALRHNYRLAREMSGARALAVVKADAYGHGSVRCAQALEAEAIAIEALRPVVVINQKRDQKQGTGGHGYSSAQMRNPS